jgi:hypothetical protein
MFFSNSVTTLDNRVMSYPRPQLIVVESDPFVVRAGGIARGPGSG